MKCAHTLSAVEILRTASWDWTIVHVYQFGPTVSCDFQQSSSII